MSALSDAIYTQYIDNFAALPFDKQFHFASRLYLYSGNTETEQILEQLRPEFTHNDSPALAFRDIVDAAAASPVHGSKNASELRWPYFEKYPTLKVSVMLLFRLAFLRSIYGIDARTEFFDICPPAELDQLYAELSHDTAAVAILSTHAINLFYLYRRFALQDESGIDPADYIAIAHSDYDATDKLHLQLCIYLYTHCIIGESMFYSRQLPETHLPVYQQMIQELEILITDNFTSINLDNKFEFLVCARMVGLTSPLEAAIYDEAAKSISDEGTYLIDKHNDHPQTDNISLDKSEHRNVLFIMSHSPFRAS